MPAPLIDLDDLDRAPPGLPPPQGIDWEKKYHEVNERFSRTSEENFSIKEENARLKSAAITRKALDDLISPYASNTFSFMCFYCAFVGGVLLLNGFYWKTNFRLDDSVIQILVGSTAVTVIGLVGMVLTGVFVGARKA